MLATNWLRSHAGAAVGLGVALVAILCHPSVALAERGGLPPYEGSDWCFNCHPTQYNDFRVSGHPFKIIPKEQAQVRPIPLPEGIRWDDVSYVVGGYKWKSRYMDPDGWFITTVFEEGSGTPIEGMNQYNYMTDEWVNYNAGVVNKPYDCGRCHTTGWIADEDAEFDGDLSDNQDGLPGIWGTWEFPGIQCEECHGPGFTMWIFRDAEDCGRCHSRGAFDTIPARGGFIRHHEQYNEHLASPHKIFACVDCHNPHKKAEFSITTTCSDCHPTIAASYALEPMAAVGVTCEDCHMPYASKSAAALGTYKGDVRTHLYRINPQKNYDMFTPDGNFVKLDMDGQGYLNLDFACKDCHPNRHDNWLSKAATNFHEHSHARKAPIAVRKPGAVSSASPGGKQ